MVDLLRRLESGLHRAAGASERLKSQVDRIDDYMRTQRALNMNAAAQQQQQNTMNRVAAGDAVDPFTYGQAQAEASGFEDQLSQFQLPPELLEDWPWPFDSEGLLPLGFE